ncbi:high-affinity nickel-transporter protein [Halobacteriales archaeon QS_4_69_34]|nr:MAG: high-affinity nickel-transporter protein [Halobacteriales archaeon QS_4_69_34]
MIETALLLGGTVGVRHALEADHVAAVATLTDEATRPGSTGAAWGIGHSIPVLALSGVFLALGLRVPPAATTAVEAFVAVVLVVLGVRAIAGHEAIGTAILRHAHGGGGEEAGGGHLHLRLVGREVGVGHTHADEESFAVGVVHGLAGSGGVVVALAAAAPTAAGGAAFLLGFSLATVVAMGLVAWGWGRAVGRADALRTAAGVASVAVGTLLLAEIAGIAALP